MLFDVNLREAMWDRPEEILPQVTSAIGQADICKISADELCRLSAQSDWRSARYYVRDLGCKTTVISLGAEGPTSSIRTGTLFSSYCGTGY